MATLAGGVAGTVIVTLTLRGHQADVPITLFLSLVLVWVLGGMLAARLAVRLAWRLHRRWYR